LGARREALGLGDERSLGGLRSGILLLELGEEVATLAVERGPRVREALPERLLRRAVETRSGPLGGLPRVEEDAQLFTGRLPLDLGGVRAGEAFGCLDDRGACSERDLLGGDPLGVELG